MLFRACRLIVGSAALLGAAALVPAQDLETGNDLRFGRTLMSAGPVSVTLSPLGLRTGSIGAVLAGSAYSAASFLATGTPSVTFALLLPSSAVLTSGASQLSIGSFTSLPSGTGTFDGAGRREILVGATLQIAPYQTRGAYSGSFDVTIIYN